MPASTVDTVALVALLVCLIPTTIGGLLSAIGIAGMDRVARFNVLAMSGRAVEASGDVDVILLDKTGTITYGNRLAAAITPAPGWPRRTCVEATLIASIKDETPEGRSIVELARKRLAELGRPGGTDDEPGFAALRRPDRRGDPVPRGDAHQRRPHDGRDADPQGRGRRDAAPTSRAGCRRSWSRRPIGLPIQGATPLAIRSDGRIVGMIELKDTIKEGLSSASPSSARWASAP